MRRADRGSDPANEFVKTIEIKNRDGQVVERKEVVTAKGLLHLAHKERLSKIRTRLIQAPTKENGENAIAVVEAAGNCIVEQIDIDFVRLGEVVSDTDYPWSGLPVCAMGGDDETTGMKV